MGAEVGQQEFQIRLANKVLPWCRRLQQACAAAQNATAQQAASARAFEADREAVRQELAQTQVAVHRLGKEVANRSAALERAAHAAEAETLRRRDGEERVCVLEDQVNRLQLQLQGSDPAMDRHSHATGSSCWVFTLRITPCAESCRGRSSQAARGAAEPGAERRALCRPPARASHPAKPGTRGGRRALPPPGSQGSRGGAHSLPGGHGASDRRLQKGAPGAGQAR